ncbi:MAG: hypothetical protein P4L40_05525 [Terracidiphilus sp.]|nr:hypothetical protein [Terracidiphilus sp.]
MSAVSILRRRTSLYDETAGPDKPIDLINVAAGTALIAGGLLMLGRQRRAGMVVAAAGSALALLDHEETLRAWWQQLPGFFNQVEGVISQVQQKVSEISERRHSIVEAFATSAESPDLQRKED